MPTSPILAIPQVTASQSSKEVTINDAINALEGAGNATLVCNYAAGTADRVLTDTQFTRFFVFKPTNASGPVNLVVPSVLEWNPTSRLVVVANMSGQAVTVKTAAAGTTVVIADGATRLIYISGTNISVAAQAALTARFKDLTDVPGSYTGQAKKIVRVKADESSIEFDSPDLSDMSDIDFSTGLVNGAKLTYDSTAAKWKAVYAAGGTSAFTGLTDVPATYAGAAGKYVRVKTSLDGLEFVNAPTPVRLSDLADFPATYTGAALKAVRVNAAATALEFYTPAGGGGGGSSTLATLTDVNLTTPSDGQVLAYDGGLGVWVNRAGGGVGTAGKGVLDNPLDYPPAVPTAFDDEFNGTTINMAWTWVNQTDVTTYHATQGNNIMLFTADAPASGWHWAALVKDKPAGDFDIVAKVGLDGLPADFNSAALSMYNSSTGKFITASFHSRGLGSTYVSFNRWNNTNSLNTDNSLQTQKPYAYVRLKKTGGTVAAYFSEFGYNWHKLFGSDETLSDFIGTDFDKIGMFVKSENNNYNVHSIFHWIRDYGVTGPTINPAALTYGGGGSGGGSPVTTVLGTGYTALAGDAGHYLRFTNAGPINFVIPPNSEVPFAVGTEIQMEQAGLGALSISAGAGVTINSRSADYTLAGQFATAFVKKVDTDVWTLNGDM